MQGVHSIVLLINYSYQLYEGYQNCIGKKIEDILNVEICIFVELHRKGSACSLQSRIFQAIWVATTQFFYIITLVMVVP